MLPKLQVIITSTRPGRVGPAAAKWFRNFAEQHGKFEAELVDVNDFALPVYDEPYHPLMQNYQHEHTHKWSASVAVADAYVFVTPEYNYGPTPAFVNALNYLYKEWNYKPCGFVSYGGAAGGVRAVQLEKLLAVTLKMMPMVEGVMMPMISDSLGEDGRFQSNDLIDASATALLDELLKWTNGLKAMRDNMA